MDKYFEINQEIKFKVLNGSINVEKERERRRNEN